jgi:hypothetical protein
MGRRAIRPAPVIEMSHRPAEARVSSAMARAVRGGGHSRCPADRVVVVWQAGTAAARGGGRLESRSKKPKVIQLPRQQSGAFWQKEPTMLDEWEKRKGALLATDQVGVKFADSQEWAIPKPFLEIRPVFEQGVAKRAYRAFAYGPPIDDLVAAVAHAEGHDVVVSVVASLAAALLRRNYDLTEDELDQLVAYRVDDAPSFAWVKSVVEITAGRYGYRKGDGNA